MNDDRQPVVVCCNGAQPLSPEVETQVLEYLPESPDQNVLVGLPSFVRDVYYIPQRTLDLLEIAAYVFSADRLAGRGRRDQVEYQSWSRRFLFLIRVRDHEFWSDPRVRSALEDALRFMTGDAEYKFEFSPGHSTPPTSLFDVEGFSIDPSETVAVTLFSGGLDSLVGTVKALCDSDARVILVSHQSQPGTKRTQRQLVEALKARFGDRILHYEFECHLKGHRAVEETQRTRSFLYASIGFAIATAYGQDRFPIYENGVTSINLRRREDLGNARASRTTHPQAIALLSALFSLVRGRAFGINLPFLWCTKTEVLERLHSSGHSELIASAVSCSRTFQRLGESTHCGECFQCVDRRVAVYAAALERWDDPGLYATDIITKNIDDGEARTTTVDYVRQARGFAQDNVGYFQSEYLSELAALVDHVPGGGTESDKMDGIWELMKRHGQAVGTALRRMRELYDDPFEPLEHRSLLGLVSEREHLKPEVARAVASIVHIVRAL